jgi:pimeloyl-ACP methyl ester carboxylesterase
VANFVLVHGAWHGGWCWRRVSDRLRAPGHTVFTPTLTGLGERSHLFSGNINLTTHVTDVVNVLEWESLSDVVLCGHSYGGMVITGVAEAVPDRIASLVYLDAFVPADGQSLFGFSQAESVQSRLAGALGGLGISPVPAAAFAVNEKDRDLVDSKCTPQPIGTFSERVHLAGRAGSITRRMYIVARGWSPSPFARFAEQVKGDPAWDFRELACGHDTMLDMPEETAALLVAAAGRSAER